VLAFDQTRATVSDDCLLRIALLTYRGKPTCGGQGVYVRHLSRALADLGHRVEVFSGPPFAETDERVPLHRLDSLDFYNEEHPLRLPSPSRLRTAADWTELAQFATGVFPEPLAFGMRAHAALRRRIADFDLVHDNQSLGYGLLKIQASGLPVIATIHHPTSVDRRVELASARTRLERYFKRRWYAFTHMQARVATRLQRILTDSRSSYDDIVRDYGVAPDRLHVVPVGVDQDVFRPLPSVASEPGTIVTMASADAPMKGLRHLLEAIAELRARTSVRLIVVGTLKSDGSAAEAIRLLRLQDAVEFVSGISDQSLVELLARAEVGVVPSLYEGFSLPAIEMSCCGLPLVVTTGGALPEVVGRDGETALHVAPGDAHALAVAIERLLADGSLRRRLGESGRRRVLARWTWQHTAQGTLEHYRCLLDESAAVEARRPGGRAAAPRFRIDQSVTASAPSARRPTSTATKTARTARA